MAVDMRTAMMEDPFKTPALRYATSPSAPQEPTLMDTFIDKGTDKLIDKGAEKILGGADEAAVKAAGAAMGDPTGGTATALGYEFLLKPFLKNAIGLNHGGMVGGPLSMGNISKVRYKKSGGKVAEEYEISFNGPLASKGG